MLGKCDATPMNLIDPLEPEFNENGRIVDYASGDLLEDRPEERVRQRLERLLNLQYELSLIHI